MGLDSAGKMESRVGHLGVSDDQAKGSWRFSLTMVKSGLWDREEADR